MRNLLFSYVVHFLSLWSFLIPSTAHTQDISINILNSPASLPLSTTGSIQVDICNTDPNNVTAPANKLNPQISVSPNVTILGATNVDGSTLANFTVLSNNGQSIRLANTTPLSNPNCLSFKVIIQGANIDASGNIGGITAVLNFQDSQTAGNMTFNDNSATSVAVVVNPDLRPDLVPLVYVRPNLLYNNSAINVVVDVVELNSITTTGVVTVKLTRDTKINLSFDPTASLVGSRSVQNSAWNFDGSDSNYYILTSKQALTGGTHLSFGFSGVFNAGATDGIVNISSVIMGNAGEIKVSNNADADKAEYFQQ